MLTYSSNLSFVLADSSKSNSGGGNSKSSGSKGNHTSRDTSHTPSSSSSSTHHHFTKAPDTNSPRSSTSGTMTKNGITYKPFTAGGPDDPILKLKKEIESVPTNVNIRIHGHSTHHLISNSNTNKLKQLSQIQQQQINSWFTNATSATNLALTNDTTIARPSSEPATKTIPGLGF